jgi:hypothetical protein
MRLTPAWSTYLYPLPSVPFPHSFSYPSGNTACVFFRHCLISLLGSGSHARRRLIRPQIHAHTDRSRCLHFSPAIFIRKESFPWIRLCPETRAIWRPTTRLSDTRSMTCSSHGHSLTETRGSVINAANLLYCNVLYMPDISA